MRRRNTEEWIVASCGFLVLAFLLAGEGFLLSKSLGIRSGGVHAPPSEIVVKALFHDQR